MPDSRFVLRDLPGVADLEARLERMHAFVNGFAHSPEGDGLQRDIDRISLALFGITEADTEYKWDYDLAAETNEVADRDHEMHFQLLYIDEADEEGAELVWKLMGWDVSDGNDYEMHALEYLGRQIICAAKGICGHVPGAELSDAETMARAEDWGTSLAAEAANYRRVGSGGHSAKSR